MITEAKFWPNDTEVKLACGVDAGEAGGVKRADMGEGDELMTEEIVGVKGLPLVWRIEET